MKITPERLRKIIKEELDFVLKENKNQKELDLLAQKWEAALKPFEKFLKLNEVIDYTPDNIVEWMIFGYSFVKNWDSVKALLKETVRLGVLDEETAEKIDAYGEETKNEIEKIIDNQNILVRAPVKTIGSLGKYFSLFALIPAATGVVRTINNIKSNVETRKQLPDLGSSAAAQRGSLSTGSSAAAQQGGLSVSADDSSSLSNDDLAQNIDAAFAEFKQTAEAEAPKVIEAAENFAEDFMKQPEEVRAQAAEKWTF